MKKNISSEKKIAVILLGIFTGVFCYSYGEQAKEREDSQVRDRLVAQRRDADAAERRPGGSLYDAEEAFELQMDDPERFVDEAMSDDLPESGDTETSESAAACSSGANPQQ